MKLSIITVNLNNASGLEETLRSVLCQTFTDYEYIVIDGDSMDGSRDVIERYAGRLAHWVSEKDSGIYNAMNKAIRVARGEYLYFLNSGDTLCGPDVLLRVFGSRAEADVIIGRINFTDSGGVYHADYQPRCRKMSPQEFHRTGVPHQASFIKRGLFEKFGLYDESYRISADWKFFLQALALGKSSYRYISVTVADFDGGGISSKNGRLMMEEIERAYRELVPEKERSRIPVKKRFTKLLSEVRNFGVGFAFRSHVSVRFHRGGRYRQNMILHWLDGHYSQVLADTGSLAGMEAGFLVWVCWLQGRDSMPEIVSKCYDSLMKYWGESRVRLITESNIREYIELPDYIWEKYHRNRFSKTHFSDILRVCFLQRYGGLWMDSTIMMTGGLNLEGNQLFTIKGLSVDDNYVSDYKWTGYCIGCAPGNMLLENLRNLLLAYWKKQDRLIDYYILDYFIRMSYDAIPSVRHLIDSVPRNNPDVSFLQFHFDEPYDEKTFKSVCAGTCLHKLSWKGTHAIVTPDGRETYHGHILNVL